VELKNGNFFYLPSRRYQKFDETLKKVLQLRREQTKTYLFTLANKLFKEYDLVGIGDYTPRGGGLGKKMRRSMNNESLIGRFKETLAWVAKRGGKSFEIWNEKNTTKTCSTPGCNFVHEKSLDPSIRSWKCPNCEITHIRDENAAKNGLKKIIKELPCLGHLEEEIRPRCAWSFDGLGIQILEFRGPPALETLIVGQSFQEIKPAM
jgi:putative transposase